MYMRVRDITFTYLIMVGYFLFLILIPLFFPETHHRH